MHQFLDQLLSNPMGKRKTLTESNSEIARRGSEQEKMRQELELARRGSQGQFGQNDRDEYETEQVEEQIIFDRLSSGGSKIKPLNSKIKHTVPHIISTNQQEQQQTVEVLSPSEYRDSQQYDDVRQSQQNHKRLYAVDESGLLPNSPTTHSDLYNGELQNKPFNQQQLLWKPFNQKNIENLINAINTARQSQSQLAYSIRAEKNLFKLFIETTINQIQQQVHSTLLKSFEERQKQIYQQLRQQIQTEYEQKLIQEQQKASQFSSIASGRQSLSGESGLSMQRKWQIEKKLIKEELDHRYQYRIQRLEQELEEQRKYSEQLINTYQENRTSANSMSPERNNQFIEEMQFVKKQLEDRDKTINELEMEIERLNEHVFDVEQKIQGIELEVENRVRERVKQLENQQGLGQQQHVQQARPIQQLDPILESSSHLEQSSRMFGFQSAHNNHMLAIQQQSQLVAQLQHQNDHLKNVIQQMRQEKASIELHIKQQQKIISFRQEQIKKNEQDINYEWTEIESERQALLNREHQLTTAEENISTKISEIRIKQSQLEKWETELQKREIALNARQNEINKKLQEIVENQNLHKQHIYKHEPSNPSILSGNNKSRKLIHEFNSGEGGGSFRPNGVDVPSLPIGKKSRQMYEAKNQKSFDNDYHFNHKHHDVISKANFERSFEDIDRSYGRQNMSRQRMAITGTNFRQNRHSNNVHQYVLPQSSKGQRKSRSKSRSKQKLMIRNNLNSGSVASGYKNQSYKGKYIDEYYNSKQSSNLDGLGSKLQRLRDQIKRQIDSIK